ncbi:hypothetical protein [Zooshikella ganghwensis]|uniref:Uncharacterized protein n=1 Tax=Zooshikella ganghwensis TaxID=202772 RepID=A0A4P9VNA4_9GAMM|nr:hypothetical protein [Zooshikella ganghwensis]RDH44928.1 hypothetical protein B9G39_16635 [Zooshikella ganghwensis]
MARLFKTTYPNPFFLKWKELLAIDLSSFTQPEPIVEVNTRQLKVMQNKTEIRNWWASLFLLGLISMLGFKLLDYYDAWKSAEWNANRFIEIAKKENGNEYFSFTQDPGALAFYSAVGDDKKMSFKEFIHDRYNNYTHTTQRIIGDIIFTGIPLLGISILLPWIILLRKPAPLIFDREKRVVYSWQKGGVWAQRYDDIRLHENIQMILFFLRCELKDGSLGWAKYPLQPTGNPLFSPLSAYKPTLAYIAQFMEYGREKVLPDQDSWQAKPPFYFRDDPEPANIEQEIDRILQRITEVNNEIPLDGEGNPIPPEE